MPKTMTCAQTNRVLQLCISCINIVCEVGFGIRKLCSILTNVRPRKCCKLALTKTIFFCVVLRRRNTAAAGDERCDATPACQARG